MTAQHIENENFVCEFPIPGNKNNCETNEDVKSHIPASIPWIDKIFRPNEHFTARSNNRGDDSIYFYCLFCAHIDGSFYVSYAGDRYYRSLMGSPSR